MLPFKDSFKPDTSNENLEGDKSQVEHGEAPGTFDLGVGTFMQKKDYNIEPHSEGKVDFTGFEGRRSLF